MRKSKTRSLKKLTDLRPRLRRQGYTLRGWARANNWNAETVKAALSGRRRGPLSMRIRKEVETL